MRKLNYYIRTQGGEEQGGMRFYAPSQMRSVKDTAGYTKMKYRQEGQGNVAELLEKDLKASLEEKERQHFSKLSRQEFIGAVVGLRHQLLALLQ